MVRLDVVVGIPAGDVARVELHEADPALDEPAGEQAAGAELRGLLRVEAVEGLRLVGLARQVDGLGRGRLHPVGELIGLDAGGELGVAVAAGEVAGVQLADQVERPPLGRARHALGGAEVEDRAGGARPHHRALMARRQEARAVRGRAALDPAGGIGQDDERGEVLVLGPQAVAGPAPEAGLAHEDRTGVHLVDGLGMVDAVGPARADDGQVIGAGGDMREEVGDLQPALAVAAERPLRAQERVGRDLPPRGHRAEARRQGPTVQALEVGLGVERVEVARPAVHEQVDDPRGPGREVGRALGEGVDRSPRSRPVHPGAARRVRPSPGLLPPAAGNSCGRDRWHPARRLRSREAWAWTLPFFRRPRPHAAVRASRRTRGAGRRTCP